MRHELKTAEQKRIEERTLYINKSEQEETQETHKHHNDLNELENLPGFKEEE